MICEEPILFFIYEKIIFCVSIRTIILKVLHIAIHCPLPATKIRGPTCKILEVLPCSDQILNYKFKGQNSGKNHPTERNSNLNCNSSRYSHIPNIKSISQRTLKKSPDNLKFEQKIQVQGLQLSQKSFDRNEIRT